MQDFRAIYPIVPNPYTLLAQIPKETKWFTALDLKDAFFYISLDPDSQYFFAFEDPKSQTSQLTGTVFPQGFRDNPHLFEQTLSKDPSEFSSDQCTLLQYVE